MEEPIGLHCTLTVGLVLSCAQGILNIFEGDFLLLILMTLILKKESMMSLNSVDPTASMDSNSSRSK